MTTKTLDVLDLVTIEDHGTIALVRPKSADVREWLEANCETEGWQWFGGAVAIEPRYLYDILDGLYYDFLGEEA